ncbi:MAG TPA: radical SAM protein [Thermoplasmata archaeon]|nr:radical SAM protein [Thermoplasmata archaeon]
MEAKVSLETARQKAELLAGGPVKLPEGFRLPFPASRSTAGPGAGRTSAVFSFGGTRAKKAISRDSGEFELVSRDGRLSLTRSGKAFIDGVELVPTLMHAPYQAFVNIESACVYDCKFCNSPRLTHDATKDLTDDRIAEMILDASTKEGFQSVAFTSAVTHSPSMTVRRMAGLVGRIRAELPNVPIGVEPYTTRPDEVDMLRDAGADEIKLNIETFDRDIFEKVCGDMDLDHILHAVNHAGEVFGRNKVCSNIIFGLGEDDENVLEGVAVLANMGAVATLRALRVDEMNSKALDGALGKLEPVTAERMLKLATEEKTILSRHGLSTLKFKTMCHACLSCDIVPFWDV